MNWITHLIPKKNWFGQKSVVPDHLWSRCTSCEKMIFQKILEENSRVCPFCDFHMPMGARLRLQHLFDPAPLLLEVVSDQMMEQASVTEAPTLPDDSLSHEMENRTPLARSADVSPCGAFEDCLDSLSIPQDPLHFRDSKKYTQRLSDARKTTGEQDAIVVGAGSMGGFPIVIAAFQFEFIGGSMGLYVGEALVKAAEKAVSLRCPLLVITSSGGARMQEGALALMQMPRSVWASSWMKQNNLPYWVIMAHPTSGGVAASFASLGDIIMAEPGAMIGFTGRRVIEETLRVSLPDSFQTADFQKQHGFLDRVVHRKETRAIVLQLLHLFQPLHTSSQTTPLPDSSMPHA